MFGLRKIIQFQTGAGIPPETQTLDAERKEGQEAKGKAQDLLLFSKFGFKLFYVLLLFNLRTNFRMSSKSFSFERPWIGVSTSSAASAGRASSLPTD